MMTAGFTDPYKIQHYDVEHQEWLGFGKLTFQLTPNINYMGMLHYNHIYEPVYQNSLGVDASYEYVRIWDHENTYTTTHQFNIILDQNTFIDVRGTYVRRFFPLHSMTPNDYTYYDNTAKVYWGAAGYNDEYIRKKMLGSASITRFQDDFLGADHEFKAGAEFEQGEYHRDWYRDNPYYSYWADYESPESLLFEHDGLPRPPPDPDLHARTGNVGRPGPRPAILRLRPGQRLVRAG